MISATWWTNSTIYIQEYSQYWYQHAVLNLITTRREFTLLQYYYNTLKHNHIILYHIWYLLHDEPTVLYIFQNTPSIVSACCIEFNHYKTRITVLQYSTTLSSIITSFCIIFDICYMMNQQYYIYSRILPVLISTCCIEFNHYKYVNLLYYQYSKTLSSIITSFCIIFDICYMMNQQYYIYSRILPVLISTCCI